MNILLAIVVGAVAFGAFVFFCGLVGDRFAKARNISIAESGAEFALGFAVLAAAFTVLCVSWLLGNLILSAVRR